MILLTKKVREELQANWNNDDCRKLKPVVKLFTPDANATWYLVAMDKDGTALGICDLGLRFPEFGYVDMGELSQVRGPFGLPIERDSLFCPEHSIDEILKHMQQQ